MPVSFPDHESTLAKDLTVVLHLLLLAADFLSYSIEMLFFLVIGLMWLALLTTPAIWEDLTIASTRIFFNKSTVLGSKSLLIQSPGFTLTFSDRHCKKQLLVFLSTCVLALFYNGHSCLERMTTFMP